MQPNLNTVRHTTWTAPIVANLDQRFTKHTIVQVKYEYDCAPIADDSADQGVSEYNSACTKCRNQLTLSLRAGNVRYDTQDRGVEEGKGMGRGSYCGQVGGSRVGTIV